jgi:DNA-binding NarL/FixJ family response regulator
MDLRMSNSIDILVADDHTIVRQGLARLLEEQADFKIVGEATKSKVLVDAYRSPRKDSSTAERYKLLSNREREVFQLIAEGHPTRRIADMLCVSISTVKSHRVNIMEKLSVDTPVKLVHFAIQLGLVDPEL